MPHPCRSGFCAASAVPMMRSKKHMLGMIRIRKSFRAHESCSGSSKPDFGLSGMQRAAPLQRRVTDPTTRGFSLRHKNALGGAVTGVPGRRGFRRLGWRAFSVAIMLSLLIGASAPALPSPTLSFRATRGSYISRTNCLCPLYVPVQSSAI